MAIIKTVTLVRIAIVAATIIVFSGLGLVCLPGCMIVPAQYKTDEQGKMVMTQPERVVPMPIIVNTYPTPVVYDAPVVYDYTPVVYRTYYPTYYPTSVIVRRGYPYYRPMYAHMAHIGSGHRYGGSYHHRRW